MEHFVFLSLLRTISADIHQANNGENNRWINEQRSFSSSRSFPLCVSVNDLHWVAEKQWLKHHNVWNTAISGNRMSPLKFSANQKSLSASSFLHRTHAARCRWKRFVVLLTLTYFSPLCLPEPNTNRAFSSFLFKACFYTNFCSVKLCREPNGRKMLHAASQTQLWGRDVRSAASLTPEFKV